MSEQIFFLNTSDILRFIWSCKSYCKPIFPKMQRTYSFFAKLLFLRPLIFQVCDSSPFKCHFQNKYCISDEGGVCFWKIYFLKIWPQGGKRVALLNFTNNLRKFPDIFELCKEEEKKVKGKLFWKYGIRFWVK